MAAANEAVVGAADGVGLGTAGSAVTTAVGAVATAVGNVLGGVAAAAGSVVGSAVATAAPAPTPSGDAGYDLLSMLGQVNGKTYTVSSTSSGAPSATANSAEVSATASSTSK